MNSLEEGPGEPFERRLQQLHEQLELRLEEAAALTAQAEPQLVLIMRNNDNLNLEILEKQGVIAELRKKSLDRETSEKQSLSRANSIQQAKGYDQLMEMFSQFQHHQKETKDLLKIESDEPGAEPNLDIVPNSKELSALFEAYKVLQGALASSVAIAREAKTLGRDPVFVHQNKREHQSMVSLLADHKALESKVQALQSENGVLRQISQEKVFLEKEVVLLESQLSLLRMESSQGAEQHRQQAEELRREVNQKNEICQGLLTMKELVEADMQQEIDSLRQFIRKLQTQESRKFERLQAELRAAGEELLKQRQGSRLLEQQLLQEHQLHQQQRLQSEELQFRIKDLEQALQEATASERSAKNLTRQRGEQLAMSKAHAIRLQQQLSQAYHGSRLLLQSYIELKQLGQHEELRLLARLDRDAAEDESADVAALRRIKELMESGVCTNDAYAQRYGVRLTEQRFAQFKQRHQELRLLKNLEEEEGRLLALCDELRRSTPDEKVLESLKVLVEADLQFQGVVLDRLIAREKRLDKYIRAAQLHVLAKDEIIKSLEEQCRQLRQQVIERVCAEQSQRTATEKQKQGWERERNELLARVESESAGKIALCKRLRNQIMRLQRELTEVKQQLRPTLR